MVLLDSLTPRAMTALPAYPGFYATFRRASALMPSLARIGVGQLAYTSSGSTLPPADRRAEHAIATSAREQRSAHEEFVALRATFVQAQHLTTLGNIPLAVITAGKSLKAGWVSEQRRMAALSTNTGQRTYPVAHSDMIEDRTDSALSSDAIVAVVRAAGTHAQVQLPVG
jgi:hypothetical protein